MKKQPYLSRSLQRCIRKELSFLVGHYSAQLWDPVYPTSQGLLRDFEKERLTHQNAPKLLIVDGNTNYDKDAQHTFDKILVHLEREDRVALIVYNSYLRWIYSTLNFLRLRTAPIPCTFLTRQSVAAITQLSNLETVDCKSTAYITDLIPLLGRPLSNLLRLLPMSHVTSVASIYFLRVVKAQKTDKKPLLSVIIPARNEAGNIPILFERLNQLKIPLELVFIEGNSSDSTWEEIQKLTRATSPHVVVTGQQRGKGKKDAVYKGISLCQGDLITILDADISVAPEYLPRFYEAYLSGKGDFLNGNRLVYPMEGEAMRPLNLMGNLVFAKLLSFVLSVRIGDSLCGTKFFSRKFYEMCRTWNENFGRFDPFGDFELIFAASALKLGVVDIPVHYQARIYGTTNIQRFRDGFQLFRMVVVGLLRIKLR